MAGTVVVSGIQEDGFQILVDRGRLTSIAIVLGHPWLSILSRLNLLLPFGDFQLWLLLILSCSIGVLGNSKDHQG